MRFIFGLLPRSSRATGWATLLRFACNNTGGSATDQSLGIIMKGKRDERGWLMQCAVADPQSMRIRNIQQCLERVNRLVSLLRGERH
jgi:hypothetical protein